MTLKEMFDVNCKYPDKKLQSSDLSKESCW